MGGCLLLGGGSASKRGMLLGGCILLGGVCFWGVVVSQHALRQTPPMDKMTDTSKNITVATTLLRPVINDQRFRWNNNTNRGRINVRLSSRCWEIVGLHLVHKKACFHDTK